MAGGNKGQKAQKREMLEVETPEERNERLAANMDTDSNDQTLLASRASGETAQSPSRSPESPMSRILEQPSRPMPMPPSAYVRSSLPCTGLRRIKEGRANGAEHEQGGARADESVLDRVAAFLPMMQQSNAELLRRAAADPRSVIVDDPEGSAEEDDEDEEGDEDDEDSSGDDEHDDDGGDEDDDEDENMEESGAEAKTARIAGQQRPRRIVEMDVNLGVYGMREGAQPSGDMGPEVMLDEERIRRHMERYGGPAAGRDGVDDGSGGSGASGGLVRDGEVPRE